jgi:hypothetical protein
MLNEQSRLNNDELIITHSLVQMDLLDIKHQSNTNDRYAIEQLQVKLEAWELESSLIEYKP